MADFAIRPVGETLFQDNYPFYSHKAHVQAQAENVGIHAPEINATITPTIDQIPEIGKGGNIDVYV